jgi:uncharacterized protein (TIGR00251 family)
MVLSQQPFVAYATKCCWGVFASVNSTIPLKHWHYSNVNDPALQTFLSARPDGLLLAVKLQPRASANEIGEPLGNELRIKVTAPPVDAAANEALLRLLADKLDCPRNRIELLRGHTSRHKVVKLHGVSPEDVLARLI